MLATGVRGLRVLGCLAGPRPRMKGRVEWACVRAPTGVCACVGVYMRVSALSGLCAHVCGCQRCGGRGTPGWLGWSERRVRELAPSMHLHSGVESWVCVPEGSFAQVCSGCGCHCVCETEDERRMPEAWVCVSPGVLHPNVGPWPPVWIVSVLTWVRTIPHWSCWWSPTGALQPPQQWRLLLGTLPCVRQRGPPVCALAVRLCGVGAWVRSPGWRGRWLMEGLSRDPWGLHGGGV